MLLNFAGVTTIPTPIVGCSFDNSGSALNPYNVRSDASTQDVQFRYYSGTLASDASVAEANDDDDNNHIHWGVYITVKTTGGYLSATYPSYLTYTSTGTTVNNQVVYDSQPWEGWIDYGTDINVTHLSLIHI